MRGSCLLWVGLAGHAAAAHAACGDQLSATGRLQAAAGGVQIAFAPRTGPLTVGRHFALDLVACAPPGTATPTALRVDADMPAHRHGMNYRATVQALGAGRFLAEGLMFHMPGRWRFIFDLDPGGGAPPLRLTQEVELE
ncbi:MAG TPA: hypothetical protein VIW70_08335 [Rubrivivax sp.]